MRMLMVVLAIVVLVSSAGSVELKASEQRQDLQDICRAPDSWMHSVLDGVQQVPAFIESRGKALEARAPGIASFIHGLPVGKGSLLEGWILKPAPRYL